MHEQRPKETYKPTEAPMEGKNNDFPAYGAVPKVQPIRPAESGLGNKGPGDYATTQQMEFNSKPIERVSPIKQQSQPLASGPFVGSTESKDQFHGGSAERMAPFKPVPSMQKNSGPMQGTTTAVSSERGEGGLTGWDAGLRQLTCSHTCSHTPPTNVQNESFAAPTNVERVQPIKPANAPRNNGKFEGVTTAKETFAAPEGAERTMAIRPKEAPKESKPFSGVTTNTVDYPGYQPGERYQVCVGACQCVCRTRVSHAAVWG
jgi:hypothetical protein